MKGISFFLKSVDIIRLIGLFGSILLVLSECLKLLIEFFILSLQLLGSFLLGIEVPYHLLLLICVSFCLILYLFLQRFDYLFVLFFLLTHMLLLFQFL